MDQSHTSHTDKKLEDFKSGKQYLYNILYNEIKIYLFI